MKVDDFVYEILATAQSSPICGIPINDATQHIPLNAPMTFSEFIQSIESHFAQP